MHCPHALVVHALGYANSELWIFSSQCHKVQGQEGPEGHISSRLRNRRPLAAVLDCSLATMTQLNATLDYECDLARAIPWYDDSDNTVHMNWCVEHAIARMPWQRGG